MPDLTRRRDPSRADCWLVYYGDVHVGTIARRVGHPGAVEAWQWRCGFYPGRGEQYGGTVDTLDQARAAFADVWQRYLPRCTEANFQAWRHQQAWTKEKYRRFDRGERMPPDWRPHG
jgi:hypothetical protein